MKTEIFKNGTSIKINVFYLFLLFNISHVFSQINKYDAYDALKTEKDLNIEAYSKNLAGIIDSIILEAEKIINIPEFIDDSTAFNICHKFSMLLKEKFGFKYQLTQTFSIALNKLRIDCNYNVLILLTFLKHMQIENVYPVVAPGHMFLRWYLNDSLYINYETTTMEMLSDSVFREEFSISPLAEKNHLYLHPLTHTQMKALHLAEIAYDIADTNIIMAIDINKKAIEIYPESYHILNNLSACYLMVNLPDSSEYFFEKAYTFDSLNFMIFKNRAKTYCNYKDYLNALYWINKAIKINPENPILYMERCEIYIELNDLDNAINDFITANNKIDKKTLMSFFVNYPYLEYLDKKIMEFLNK